MFKKFLTVAVIFVIIAGCFTVLCFADENIANEAENNSAAGLSLDMNGVERIEVRSNGSGHSGENNYITQDQNEIKYIINTINSWDLTDDGKKIYGADGRSDSIYVYYNDGSKKFLNRFSGRIYYNDEKQYGIKDLKGIFELISAFKTKEFMFNHEVTFEPSDWAKNSIDKTTALGLLEGSGGKFRPKDSITKEEVITILLRLHVRKR